MCCPGVPLSKVTPVYDRRSTPELPPVWTARNLGPGLLQQTHRVHGFTVEPRLEVRVAAGGVAGGTRVGNELPLADLLPHRHHHTGVVVVDGGQRIALDHAVGDLDVVSAAVIAPACGENGARSRRIHGRTAACAEVDSGVHVA